MGALFLGIFLTDPGPSVAGNLQAGGGSDSWGRILGIFLTGPGPKKASFFGFPKTLEFFLRGHAMCKLIQFDMYHVFLQKSENS